MPSLILKASPEEDWYVSWSTVVDAPVDIPGTRQEYAAKYGEERVARAERIGTSMWHPDAPTQWFAFDDDGIVMTAEGNPIAGQGWINRSDLRAYVEAMVADDQAGMLAVHHAVGGDDE